MINSTHFYRPVAGWFGDVMPIVSGNTCHLFYTHLDADDTGSPLHSKKLKWGHLSTEDFVHFHEYSTAIPSGTRAEPDLLAGAGSVIGPIENRYIAFYVGINPHSREQGKPEQVVLRAYSDDLVTFTKDPGWQLTAPPGYYTHAWRDPYVYEHPDGGWAMLLCTQLDENPARRAGAIGVMRSTDLDNWHSGDPLWAPGTTLAPECPETFTLGGEQYLLFSTYSDRFAVRYRRFSNKRWETPAWDALDSNDFYAATSVEFRGERILVGWLATRLGDRDQGKRQWGGDLVAHRLVRRENGTLGTIPLESRVNDFQRQPLSVELRSGTWDVDENLIASTSGDGFNWISLGKVDTRRQSVCFASTVMLDSDAEESGVALFADDEFTRGYLLRFEPRRERFTFDRRPHTIEVPFDFDAERGYVNDPDFEIERPLRPGSTHEVTIILEGTCLSIYVDDVALTTRAYDLRSGHIAAYACSGNIRLRNTNIGERPHITEA